MGIGTVLYVIGCLAIIYVVSIVTLLRSEFKEGFKKLEENKDDTQ